MYAIVVGVCVCGVLYLYECACVHETGCVHVCFVCVCGSVCTCVCMRGVLYMRVCVRINKVALENEKLGKMLVVPLTGHAFPTAVLI